MADSKKNVFPNPDGRPPMIADKEIYALIIESLSLGMSIESSMRRVGVSSVSYHAWKNKGEAAQKKHESGKKLNKNDKLYLKFINDVKKTKEDSIANKLKIVHEAAKGGREIIEIKKYVTTKGGKEEVERTEVVKKIAPPIWQAAMRLLESQDPQQFGRKVHQTIAGDQEKPVIDTEKTIDDFLKRFEQKKEDAK